jgi:hypothetical protein
MMRGHVDRPPNMKRNLALVKSSLITTGLPHWKQFIAAWEASC